MDLPQYNVVQQKAASAMLLFLLLKIKVYEILENENKSCIYAEMNEIGTLMFDQYRGKEHCGGGFWWMRLYVSRTDNHVFFSTKRALLLADCLPGSYPYPPHLITKSSSCLLCIT